MAPNDYAIERDERAQQLTWSSQSPSQANCAGCPSPASLSSSSAPPPVTKKTQKRPSKTIRWAKITVYEFGVALADSAVAERGGPAIGLANKPNFMYCTSLDTMPVCVEGVHRFTPKERYQLLQKAGVSDEVILGLCKETQGILRSRKRSLAESLAKRCPLQEQNQDSDRVLEDGHPHNQDLVEPEEHETRMLGAILKKAQEKSERRGHSIHKRVRLLGSCT